MTAVEPPGLETRPSLRPLYSAARARLGLVSLLLVLAGAGWWWSARQMSGMDDGPWTALGGFGWFLGIWVVMMAAMMLPSVAPTVALYARMSRGRSSASALLFPAGYLLTWAAAGVVAYAAGVVINRSAGTALEWGHAGRALSGGTLLLAAGYEFTPLKEACLGRCRSPLGALLGSWRDGPLGAVRMGARNGAWCVGCCWALMAALFALGVMSVLWMAVVAGLIALEKTLPYRRVATYGTAALLLAVGLLLLVTPDAVPGLTIPGMGGMSMVMSTGQ